MIKEIFMDAGADTLKMLPFLFAAFLVIEALEHYSTEYTKKVLVKVGKAGPVVGAAAGCVPQCGFSVLAANLYAGGIVSPGTLLSVLLATSDEAVLIILGNPDASRQVVILLALKVIIGITAGYITDIFFKKYILSPKEEGNLCGHCGCHEHEAGIVRPALNHTVRIVCYLFVFTLVLNLCIEVAGIDKISRYLFRDTWFQPAVAAVIGLIPNCAASVMLTQLYLCGAISFASVLAGLCSAAGVGLVVLFKVNHDKKENLKILIVLYAVSVIAGMIAGFAGI